MSIINQCKQLVPQLKMDLEMDGNVEYDIDTDELWFFDRSGRETESFSLSKEEAVKLTKFLNVLFEGEL